MKVVVHSRSDGGVTVSHFSSSILAVMTGAGYVWSQERIDYEVGKFVAGGKAEDVIRPYVTALANGGVTEAQAIELIRAKDDKADCLSCTVIEDTDVPTDRYFRDAWEWSN
jgi:hypothetical protein